MVIKVAVTKPVQGGALDIGSRWPAGSFGKLGVDSEGARGQGWHSVVEELVDFSTVLVDTGVVPPVWLAFGDGEAEGCGREGQKGSDVGETHFDGVWGRSDFENENGRAGG